MLAHQERQAVPTLDHTGSFVPRRALTYSRVSAAIVTAVAILIEMTSATTAAQAQPGLRVILGGPAPQVELTEPRVNTISSTTVTRLEQARALADAGNWDEAIDIYNELAADDSDRVIALDDRRYVSVRTYCQLQLARLPPPALANYRRRADPLAERYYHEGVKGRDEIVLARILNEAFCSSWGDLALLALGDLALERGDTDSARRFWTQINDSLHASQGNSDRLVYPDTKLDLADIRARMIIASIRAGHFDRAATELTAFRQAHPAASGRIAGQQGLYVATLERILTSARQWQSAPPSPDWPTFAGAQSRMHDAMPVSLTLSPLWEQPLKIAPPPIPRRAPQFVFGALATPAPPEERPAVSPRESGRPLSSFPVVAGDIVLFADAVGIHAASLATGKPAVTPSGLLFRDESADAQADENTVQYNVIGVAHGVPRLTLNVKEHTVFGRVGPFATNHPERRQGNTADRIVGLDLRREGLLALRIPPGEVGWSFDGTPVSDGRRLYVGMRRGGAVPSAYVACFDTVSSQRLWRTSIGSADTPAGALGNEISHSLLTLAGDRIFFNTNLGLVAALDVRNGEICWIAKYPRLTGRKFATTSAMPLHFDRDPSPAVYYDGKVFVAPADTPDVLALDADTGQTLWVNHEVPDALQLLGVVGDRLIASGNRLASLDIVTGKSMWVWPESSTAGIRGLGRGLIAGGEVFWPTRSEIYVLEPGSGARTRAPISISSISDSGANLASAAGYLIVAGYDKLQCLGPPQEPTRPPKPSVQSTGPVRTGHLSNQSISTR